MLPVLAIITPCYNEELIVEKSCNIMLNILKDLENKGIISDKSFISVVDDGSTDNSFLLLSKIAQNEKKIKLIKFPCNFGHQQALLCGITQNIADIYIYMDFDLQDDIEIIPNMIEKYKNNNLDIVYGVRKDRSTDSLFKKTCAIIFYKLSRILGLKGIANSADFNLISDKVATILRNINQKTLYLRGLLHLYNFKYETIYYKRKSRIGGLPKYNFIKSFLLALDAITSCSRNLVYYIFLLGFICILRCIFIEFSDIYFVGSMILFALGIIGIYIYQIYTESKNNPNYVISEKINY